MDEAGRKGIQVDARKLSAIIGIPVVQAIARTGKGIRELFGEVLKVWEGKKRGNVQKFSKDIEEVIHPLATLLAAEKRVDEKVSPRFLAVKLLEKDESFMGEINPGGDLYSRIQPFQKKLEEMHGSPSDEVISSERHALAMNLFEKVSTVIHPPKKDIRMAIDQWVMHNLFGYLILAAVFYGFFNFIFAIGGYVERPLMGLFDHWIGQLGNLFGEGSLSLFLSKGILQGIAGGLAIVLPYLAPFLIGLSILEDVGYLPRVAFLMDVLMHRVGLHGKAIIPLILGYGCSVPAVMSTRILEFPQHRFIVSILTTMIPCAARITIIFALVAFLISPNAALAIFVLNILIVAISGKVFSLIYPEAGLGLILEIPAYQWPPMRNTLKKSWYRIREFIVIAWPLLIGGSALLALMEYGKIDLLINRFLSPLTHLLGLPSVVGTTLIFGLLRKELSLIMLTQALGTTQILTLMTQTQVMVFAVFVIFYIPCLATIAALWREIGKKGALWTIFFTLFVAILLALGTRLVAGILLP
jgi:ferrous iron transport protein B